MALCLIGSCLWLLQAWDYCLGSPVTELWLLSWTSRSGPFDPWGSHLPWVGTPYPNLRPSGPKPCLSFWFTPKLGPNHHTERSIRQTTSLISLAVHFEGRYFSCHLTLITILNQWQTQDIKSSCRHSLSRKVHMSKNFFLFPLDLNWIFLGNQSDKSQQERT